MQAVQFALFRQSLFFGSRSPRGRRQQTFPHPRHRHTAPKQVRSVHRLSQSVQPDVQQFVVHAGEYSGPAVVVGPVDSPGQPGIRCCVQASTSRTAMCPDGCAVRLWLRFLGCIRQTHNVSQNVPTPVTIGPCPEQSTQIATGQSHFRWRF